MIYGMAILSIVPVRKEPQEQSEMVSQVLFGESFEILQSKVGWLHIRIDFDYYEGWIDLKHCHFISKRYHSNLLKRKLFVSPDLYSNVVSKDLGPSVIVAGSSIPNYKGKLSFKAYHTNFRFRKYPERKNSQSLRDTIIHQASKYINAPYLWGGKSPFGIDCSGLVQVSFKACGIRIPRDASQQVNYGTAVNFVNEAKPGDLAFFDNNDGKIIHVGIIMDGARIIHASGKVRIDYIDHEGIINKDTMRYTHQLRVVKNLLEPLSEFDPESKDGIQQKMF